MLVYDIGDEARPQLLQVLSTGEEPEGDGTISIFQLGGR